MEPGVSSKATTGASTRSLLWVAIGAAVVAILAFAFAFNMLAIRELKKKIAHESELFQEIAGRQMVRDVMEAERQEGEDTCMVGVGDSAPPFEVTTIDGQTIRSADLRGRVVVLVFFATWCGPCKEEMDRLQTDVWERFRSKGLVVLAASVSSRDTLDSVREMATKYGYTFTCAIAKRDVFARYSIGEIPQCYLIDPEGRIRLRVFVKTSLQRLVHRVDAELKRSPTTMPSSRPEGGQ